MVKKIIKEIVIALLILIAITLILGILFYDYIPNNKTVPIEIQSYSMPEDVTAELEEAIPDEQNIVRTYYIDSTDLDVYEITNDYDKGKPNPFAEYKTNVEDNSSDSVEDENTTTNDNTNNNTDNSENDQQDDTNKNEVYINTPGKNY